MEKQIGNENTLAGTLFKTGCKDKFKFTVNDIGELECLSLLL